MQDIENYNFKHKKVLIRVDFNIPMNKKLQIVDDIRIKTTIPTIKRVLKNSGSVILISHLGRPKGTYEQKYSLSHLLAHLKKTLKKEILFSPNCIGPDAQRISKSLRPGEILLLENLRFHNEEMQNNPNFAHKLASLADVYINDAFGASHREHASIVSTPLFFKDKMMGYTMLTEISNADKIIKSPLKPFTTILGGAKVSDKIELIDGLLNKVDTMLIGGGMANTFIKSMGGKIGSSNFEKEKLITAKKLNIKAQKLGVNMLFPTDTYIADRFHNDSEISIASSKNIPENWKSLDIGPQTQFIFGQKIRKSKTILWNGPMGVFEMPNFQEGTKSIAEDVCIATEMGAFSLIGGGDTASAIHGLGLDKKVSYISTGGGALLTYLANGTLVGIEALKCNHQL